MCVFKLMLHPDKWERSPNPESVGAITFLARGRRRSLSAENAHPPCQPPCTRTTDLELDFRTELPSPDAGDAAKALEVMPAPKDEPDACAAVRRIVVLAAIKRSSLKLLSRQFGSTIVECL
jgi:hypothetical protein